MILAQLDFIAARTAILVGEFALSVSVVSLHD
jgi:hypothetical protein